MLATGDSLLVAFHIGAGTVGLLSGTMAMALRKGSRWHGTAGRVFALSMLGMAGSGAYIGLVRGQTVNLLMGWLTFYLVLTGWAAARRKGGRAGVDEWVALLLGLGVGASMAVHGWQAAQSAGGKAAGYPAGFFFFWGAVALFAVAGDVSVMRRGMVAGPRRTARHLWRMCVAMLIAALSFFLGQQKVFPLEWRGWAGWFVPPLLVLVFLLFWLARVWRKGQASGVN